ncbi:helix-turn-helix domain-containing protein [Nocardiopsis eucommiae]|uniref:helix-turn-helix domain-containing protein n=1 Tax=Nocardiopsis eucommiae TaxID=2831970 RepID=UPI003D72D2CE
MVTVSRQTRAQLARDASRIRADLQRRGAPVAAIHAEITRHLPISPLEGWRLAYGWSRPHVVEAVGELYQSDGLAVPGLTTAMLCRWEHGNSRPSSEYGHALARIYGVPSARLGIPQLRGLTGWYGHLTPHPRQEGPMQPDAYPDLTAVADSIALNGPGAGTVDLAERAVEFYAARYSDYPPRVLAAEVARCRSLLINGNTTSMDMRRVVGWLSGLLGSLGHHTGDVPASLIHFGTAARVGEELGERRLAAWALGAQSMVTMSQDRRTEALELAHQAEAFADDDLQRAQITAWCRLRPLAALGDRARLDDAITTARRHMDAADREEPGRFGFDRAEFHQHLAEALLDHDSSESARHAETSIRLKRVGSPGWAAATTILARTYATRRDPRNASVLGMSVLETVPAGSLRANTRARLFHLVDDLDGHPAAGDLVEALGV